MDEQKVGTEMQQSTGLIHRKIRSDFSKMSNVNDTQHLSFVGKYHDNLFHLHPPLPTEKVAFPTLPPSYFTFYILLLNCPSDRRVLIPIQYPLSVVIVIHFR